MTAIAFTLVIVGAVFFIVGTAGILRLPDLFSRLHAITKADTVGLGFIVLGLSLISGDGWTVAKMALVWLLALVSATTVAQLIAARAARDIALTDNHAQMRDDA